MKNRSTYLHFLLMILTSMAVMFITKYFNTYSLDHVYWSETRFYMAFLMGAAMAVVMLSFMLGMYKDKKKNVIFFIGSIFVFILSLWLVRSQSTVSEESWMKAMIPHHSIAILTSERENIQDPRVKELANVIIKSQRKEIKEMKWLLQDIQKNGPLTNETEAISRPVPNFDD